jgi:hypothetical protein
VKKLSLRIAFLLLGLVTAVDRMGYAQVQADLSITKTDGATTAVPGTTTV